MEKILYIKGGRAIEEARRLFNRVGELPDGGPDKFLLAVLFYARKNTLRLASFGPKSERIVLDDRVIIEYAARSTSPTWFKRRLDYGVSGLKFFVETLWFRPKKILCGVDGPFALFAWAAACLSGAKFIFLAHNALALSSMSLLYRFSNKFVCRRANAVIAHGPFVRDETINLGALKVNVFEFNNALDHEHVTLVDHLPEKQKNETDIVILYVGRIEEDKGVIDLFNAFRDLNLNIRLRFIGSGSANVTLQQLILQYKLEDKVDLLGSVPFEEVFAHMRFAAVTVTPSQSRFPEGFCKSAMESFYVGTPVIAPSYGPFPYMVKHEDNGLLYVPDDINSLTQTLQRFFTESDLRQRLEAGAQRWGKVFMRPEVTFSQALERVLH